MFKWAGPYGFYYSLLFYSCRSDLGEPIEPAPSNNDLDLDTDLEIDRPDLGYLPIRGAIIAPKP